MKPDQIKALSAPLSTDYVKKNPKGYDYIEGWHAIAEANRIFGFDAWDRATLEMVQLGEPEMIDGKWRVAYRCRCRITVRDGEALIVRDGTGYGSGIGRDVRDIHESATKEAETDAMKRALMTFGNPFGLALYDKERVNVAASPDPVRVFADQLLKDLPHATNDDLEPLWKQSLPKLKEMGLTSKEDPIFVELKDAFAKRREMLAEKEAA